MQVSERVNTEMRNHQRYQMTQILGDAAREMRSELDSYADYFTQDETLEAKAIVARLQRLRDRIDETE